MNHQLLELRYLTMRATRTTLALACEATAIVSVMIATVLSAVAALGLMSRISWGHWSMDALPAAPTIRDYLFMYPGTFSIVLWVFGFMALAFTFAFNVPYHFKSKMPGIVLKECWRCNRTTRDRFKCDHCGKHRPTRFGTLFLQCLSYILTGINGCLDLIKCVVWLAR
jgi:hypothetical protein